MKVLVVLVLVLGVFACSEKKAQPTTHVVEQPATAVTPVVTPTPVVTQDSTPLEEGMSLDATPIPVK